MFREESPLQAKDFRAQANALGITYRRVWDGHAVQTEIRDDALAKATYWLSEADAGRGHATTLELVRDLMDLVHEIDVYRSERAAAWPALRRAAAHTEITRERETLLGGACV